MSTTPLPKKEDLPQHLWDIATTLSSEAQNAGLKRARDLGFDLERGRISLEETLINLNHAREVLLDAVEKAKLVQLPLKLQYSLLVQTQRVSQSLASLIRGEDTVLALEDSVDDLTSSIWQYNLQNLSGEVLGFAQKMNQLKSEETLIRRAHRQAEEFTPIRDQAQEIAARLIDIDAKAQESLKSVNNTAERAGLSLKEIAISEETPKRDRLKLRRLRRLLLKSCDHLRRQPNMH